MTIRDITPWLEHGMSAASGWSVQRAAEVLERGRHVVRAARLDWDRAAGEVWGRLVVADRIVLALSCLLPVAIVVAPTDTGLSALLEEFGVQALHATDWDRPEFSADPGVVQRAFGRAEWSPAVDPGAFSASELWWMTV